MCTHRKLFLVLMLEVSHRDHAVGAVDVAVAVLSGLEGEHGKVALRIRALVQTNGHARYTCRKCDMLTTT